MAGTAAGGAPDSGRTDSRSLHHAWARSRHRPPSRNRAPRPLHAGRRKGRTDGGISLQAKGPRSRRAVAVGGISSTPSVGPLHPGRETAGAVLRRRRLLWDCAGRRVASPDKEVIVFKLRKPTPAFVIACIALFAALSSSAIALSGSNSVRSDDIAKGAVKKADLAANAVNSAKVINKSLKRADFANNVLLQGPQGQPGSQGPQGPQGPPGAPGGPANIPAFTFTQVPAFTNGWTTLAGREAGFGEDVQGFVHLRGVVRAGTKATSAFTLPAGLRPTQAEAFGAGQIFGGNSTICVVTVNTNGNVVPGVIAGDTGCQPAGSISLSGITFLSD